MNQKEIQAVRQSLRLIASGEVLQARRMLAGLTMTGKPSKAIKPCYLCERTIDTKDTGANWIIPSGRKYAAMPAHSECVTKAEIERDRIWAELDAARIQIQFDVKAAEYCACGHHGTVDHARDEMENLLKCNVRGCDCDHFRMATATESVGCDPTCAACENGEHGGCDCPCTEAPTHVGNQAVTISRADRIAMENLNADIEAAEDREYGLDAVGE
jgi:hypothetical protein